MKRKIFNANGKKAHKHRLVILYPDGTRKITYEGKTIKERFEDKPNSKRSNDENK